MSSLTTVANEIDALEFRLSEAKARIRELEQELERQVTTAHSRSEHAAQNAEALATENAVLREALEELADRGIRCDLNPTANMSDPVAVYQSLTSMLKFADGVVRSIASTALAQCAPEEVTA